MIICVFGNSGSGKDYVISKALELAKETGTDLTRMKMVTDRPKRKDEDSSYYEFLTKKEFSELIYDKELIEFRCYDTQFGVWRYGTTDKIWKEVLNPDKSYITTCTPRQFTELWNNTPKVFRCQLQPIVLEVSDTTRLLRMIERVDGNFVQLQEVCRRFADDEEYLDTSKIDSSIKYSNSGSDNLRKIVLDILRLANYPQQGYPNYDESIEDKLGTLLHYDFKGEE